MGKLSRKRIPLPRLFVPEFAKHVYESGRNDSDAAGRLEGSRICPPVCGTFNCPNRRKRDTKQEYTAKVMNVVWNHTATHDPVANIRRLLLVTITFAHPLQLLKLEHCARNLYPERSAVLWFVVEDASETSPEISSLLRRWDIAHMHLAHGPTRLGGNMQRNLALKIIRDAKIDGVVYNMDDDNGWHPRLWNELRRVKPMGVGIFAVRRGVYPPPRCDGSTDRYGTRSWRTQLIERPLYDGFGRFFGFRAGWCKNGVMVQRHGARKFCVDMGGFAFDAALLQRVRGEPWNITTKPNQGESRLIEMLLPSGLPEDLQPLANCGRDVLVFHNEWRSVPLAISHPKAHNCGVDGRGRRDTNVSTPDTWVDPWWAEYQKGERR